MVRNLPAMPLSTLWIGPTLPALERLCIQSWLDAGYNIDLYCYEKVANVPVGVNQLDAAHIFASSQIIRNETGQSKYAGLSNLFSYRLLRNREDAVWIGADVYAGSLPIQFSDYMLAWENRFFVNGAVLRAPKNSKFLELCEERCLERIRTGFRWVELGPRLITEIVKEIGMEGYVSPPRRFYGLRSTSVWRLYHRASVPKLRSLRNESEAIRLWSNVVNDKSYFLKNVQPQQGSFLFDSSNPERNYPARNYFTLMMSVFLLELSCLIAVSRNVFERLVRSKS